LTGATNGAGTGYPPGAPVLTPKVLVGFVLLDRMLSFFLLVIVLSVLLRFTDFDNPFGIFKLFLRFQVVQGRL
jgi:hypothetical protein